MNVVSRKLVNYQSPQFHLVILMAFFFFEYVRPQTTLTFIGPLRLPGILTLLSIWVFFASPLKQKMFSNPIVKLQVLFMFLIGVGVLYVVNHTYWLSAFKNTFLYLFGACLPLMVVLTNFERIKRFFRFWTLCFVLIFLYLATHGGKGPGSFLADENDLAVVMCIGMSFGYYLAQSPYSDGMKKWLYRFVFLCCAVGVILTSSRGGFLGMLSVFFVIWYLSEKRMKAAAIVLFMVVLATPIVISLLPDGYIEDMQSISDTNDRTRNERLRSWRYGLYMFADNPVFGVGAGNYPWTVHEFHFDESEYGDVQGRMLGGRQAHSVWFTLIPELGLSGCLVYFGIVYLSFKNLRRLRRELKCNPTKENRELWCISSAIMVSYISFFINGTFISILYYPEFWHLTAFALVISNYVGKQVKSKSETSAQS